MTIPVFTPNTRKTTLYTDFRKDLKASPVSKDLALLKNEDAVKDAIKNLLLTDQGERLMQPYLGGGIRQLLFENVTPATISIIKKRVEKTIKAYEPRAELIDVVVTSNIDDNRLGVTVRFYVINAEQPITLDVILERIR